MAPEMLQLRQNVGYSGALSDIFALGVTFFTMTFGIPPFLQAKDSDDYFRMFNRLEGGASRAQKFISIHPATKRLQDLLGGEEAS